MLIGTKLWHLASGERWEYIGRSGMGLIRVYHPEHGIKQKWAKAFSRGPRTAERRKRFERTT